ncbi:2475_t:CDS:2 [Entrophospora sp. SA101]|nr:2475_t:CDS:2 [Entrophospora sp. SA101]
MESNPKFDKINRYRNIRDTVQIAIDSEENRLDDPMDVDYTLYNLSRQLPVETYTTNSVKVLC